MSSTTGELQIKDRKKSAHWSDADTDVLVSVLVRHKDTGRTADNGFKPEVWNEAASLLQGTAFLGGPKTPEACKSRWQRLQRDYKAVKDLETYPGFSWDRSAHKLIAPPHAWEAVEKINLSKCQKIHLPSYDTLAVLCPLDSPRHKLRTKTRVSLESSSNSEPGSMLSMSVSTSSGSTQSTQGAPETPAPRGRVPSGVNMGGGGQITMASQGVMVGHGMGSAGQISQSSTPGPGRDRQGTTGHDGFQVFQDLPVGAGQLPNGHSVPYRQAQNGEGQSGGASSMANGIDGHAQSQAHGHDMMNALGGSGLMSWATEGDEDANVEFNPSFEIAEAANFTLQPSNGKRIAFDPSLLPGAAQAVVNQGSAKKPRLSLGPAAPMPRQPNHAPQSQDNPRQHSQPQTQALPNQQSRSQLQAQVPAQSSTHAQQSQSNSQSQSQTQSQSQSRSLSHSSSSHSTSQPPSNPPQHMRYLTGMTRSPNIHDALLDTTLLPSKNSSNSQAFASQGQPQAHGQAGGMNGVGVSHPLLRNHPNFFSTSIPAPSPFQSPTTTTNTSTSAAAVPIATSPTTSTPPSAATFQFPIPLPLPLSLSYSHAHSHPHSHPHSHLHAHPHQTQIPTELSPTILSESQRRTEAILQLQDKEIDLSDEDMVEIVAEFEGNVAAADTYLAIRRDGLRRRWLRMVLERRRG